ncbi:MAG: ABC transporter ATP-binding protein [Methylophagaceae bacterium]|jgi:putative ABC transport system ATP-binding protein|tara:strand:- start:1661 stop:2350 length:690 start_codon:yes stop_codon:yes gene_type:complete
MNKIVELRGLDKHYQQGELQVKAIDNVSLTIEKRDFAALCGPSGSGKTSILNLIGGLDSATSGKVLLEGIDLSALSNGELAEVRKNRVGFVFQSYNLIPVMTAYENAAFVLELQDIKPAMIRARVMKALADVGLAGMEERRPDQMSGGQQQRVAIARAIVTSPAIVLADEPTANVDSKTAELLLDLMEKLNREQGVTFLFSTHDQHVIDRAKRIIHILDGQVESDEQKI